MVFNIVIVMNFIYKIEQEKEKKMLRLFERINNKLLKNKKCLNFNKKCQVFTISQCDFRHYIIHFCYISYYYCN